MRPVNCSSASAVEDLVRDRSRLPDRRDLPRFLDRAQALDESRLRHGVDTALPQLLVRGDGDDVGLDPDRPARQPRREVADHGARGLLEADALERAGLLRVAEVGEERRLAVGLDEHGRVRALETDQIADVDAARDEQRLVQQRGEPLDPAHCFASHSSASL